MCVGAILIGMAETNSIKQTTFSNGLTLVFEAMPWLPSVSFGLLLPVGALGDPAEQEGSATVLNDWLYRGAGALDSRQLSDTLDGLGVRRGGGAGTEYATLSASLLATSLPEALALYADIVRRPRLEAAEFEGARTLALQELASLDDNPTQRLFLALSERYFASAHGRSPYGSAAGLTALTPESVRADYARRISPQGAILSVAGGAEWETLKAQVEEAFGDWQGEAVSPAPVAVNPAHSEHLEADTSQVQIGVSYLAPAPDAAGWYENSLANAVLSGGMGSRLFAEVREKRGLVYSVMAVGRALKDFGYTLAYAGTTPERADETLEVLLAELRRIREGVSAEELERARTGILSRLVMQGESSGARANVLARDSYLLGEPRPMQEVKAAIEAVTLEDLNRYLAGRPVLEPTVLTLGPKAAANVVEER